MLPARLSLDPVFAVQRPLYFYLAIAALNGVTHLLMRHVLGFTRLKKYDAESQYVYYRPAPNSTAGAKKVPLVFVHGIGIGFTHYLPLIASFPTDTDVFLVEWPHVGMYLFCLCCYLLMVIYSLVCLFTAVPTFASMHCS